MASRKLTDLDPELQVMARSFLTSCGKRLTSYNVEIIVTCTYRSPSEQADLYAIGRTKPGDECRCGGKPNPIGKCAKHPLGLFVTKAKPNESAHNITMPDGTPAACAFDIVPLRSGKPIWDATGNGDDEDPSDDLTDSLELWLRLGKLGRMCGLEWAGDWTTFKEYPHFQLPNWKSRLQK
jgi:peptidoglycan L-alanyl-D-glutamate endopeptidase CwlK